ncbi:alkaline shock response membrane anchor protein AmaP [Streptomonospora sp. S1-112]|uniref:Alkaline shock response membrane anchor protein AmaP n=1 Tax=Streptomonospora mangrovi TaxID=2883123 RepID=A0A9X3NJE5_9ACTN|nr:alkaline shock response membrane anchor protein AmaP [Streptomonospora mangrovi]MDA0562899.1 alkaline shock response membrane anchor protein AmaP [Streptomonospora mangrovi]
MTTSLGRRARRSARGNRWGLALVGLVVTVLGAAALAAGRGLLPVAGPRAALAEAPGALGIGGAWVPYAAAVAAVVVAVLALRWLAVQGRGDTVDQVAVEPDPSGGTTDLPARAARGAFEDAVREYPGVRRARAHLTESTTAPHMRLDLTLDDDADVTAVWRRVRAEALADLRTALDLERVPAVVRVSMAAPPRNPRRALA